MKTRTITLLSVLGLAVATSHAQHIDDATARTFATQFFNFHAKAHCHKHSRQLTTAKINPVLSYTATTNGIADFYVFNREAESEGFVIVNAAADTGTPILGYADNVRFDYDSIPDNLRWWLSLYQSNGIAKVPVHAPRERHDIPPLISTQWGQTEPFNLAIPQQSGYKRFATGCVATAMAQVMKFWEYPTRGKGSNAFERTYNGGEFTLSFSANFGATTYDWAHMLDTYDANSSATANNAVAKLMYHAGVSVNMKYGNSSTSDCRDAAIALTENFGYDASTRIAQREFYTDEAWSDVIYRELAEGRPMLYAGSTATDAGHAFVCHGYEAENDLYAINWGWNGSYDGYFALVGPDALKPYGTGTGGGSDDDSYTNSQRIVYHILPDEGGEPVMQVGTYGNFIMALNTKGSATPVDHIDVDRTTANPEVNVYYNFSPYNYGSNTIVGGYGAIMRNVVSGVTYHTSPAFNATLKARQYVSHGSYDSFGTRLIPYNGTYEILPAFTIDGGITWTPVDIPADQTVPTITITGGDAPEPVALPITLTASTIEVGKTATIAHSPYYTGSISYTSSNPAVASVNANGVITAHRIGNATISVSATADEAYLATDAAFDVSVVEHIVRPYDMKVSQTDLLVGATTTIAAKGYTGSYTYTYSPGGIVSADPDGTIHALSSGRATVYATTADPDYDHYETVSAFTFDVKQALPTPSALIFDKYPFAGDNNVISSTNNTITLSVINNSGSTISPARVYFALHSDYGTHNGYTGYVSLSSGRGGEATIDLSSIMDCFTPGKSYNVYFYLDADKTMPMNVPSLTFSVGKSTTVSIDIAEGICTTLSLPFATSVPNGLEAYEIDAYYNQTFRLTPVTTLQSGRSYIIAGATGHYQFTGEAGPITANPTWRFMTGLQHDANVPAGTYCLSGNLANALVRTTSATTAPLWTSYITLPLASESILSLSQFTDESIITDVNVPLAPNNGEGIYTLDGRRASSLQPGVNIVGHRKVMQ